MDLVQEPKPENQDLNKDMEANANENSTKKLPVSLVNLTFNFIDFDPMSGQEEEKNTGGRLTRKRNMGE